MDTVKLLTDVHGLRACESLQQRVWGREDETLAASHMVAAVHAGGMAAGAFQSNRLLGFVFGFVSYRPQQPQPNGLHSHLLAVLPEHRGQAIGKTLKWFQREWCLAHNLAWVTWTFDPLQAKNARLNLEHLGAVATSYRVDEYGILGGALAGTLPTDRLLAFWDLSGFRATGLAQGLTVPGLELETLPPVLVNREGYPGALDTSRTEPKLRVDIPANFTNLLHHNPNAALAWRFAVRKVMQAYLAVGYTVTRFIDTSYVLERQIQKQ